MLSKPEKYNLWINSELFKVEKNGGEEWGKHGNQCQKFLWREWGRGRKSVFGVYCMQDEKLYAEIKAKKILLVNRKNS